MSAAVCDMRLCDLLDRLGSALDTLEQSGCNKGNCTVLTPLEHSVIRAALNAAAEFVNEQNKREASR
jgi:hypothetical protein